MRLQVWAIHHLQLIGEAAMHLSQHLREFHNDVPWVQMIALRNILVHEYFGLNLEQLWTMVRRDLPKLDEQMRRIQKRLNADLPG